MKKIIKIVPILVFMMMCLTILTPAVMAAENPVLELDASVRLSGAVPETPADFLIKLSADEISNPMPEGSINGVSTKMVKGATLFTLPKITFNSTGTYSYKVTQEAGSDQNYTYDTSVYQLYVYVSGQASNLSITAVAYKNGGNGKSSDIIFNNR